ncbi:DsbA family protein [Agrobacterium sp. a22-2]|uniref:DsbA family protein n=1 Tax=Agrobacterium sp. a22-2 TaxID=2283840 RepID=UPI00144872EC|nr:DsbA family protein [Agrobacterium sp. a22-2]NKN35005.1 DsbA family protein [Agrobacterium sp. a22-2]
MLTRRHMLGTAALALIAPRASFAVELTQHELYFDKDAPVLGNPKGDVTLVEFFDYQCGYCKSSHPIVRRIVKEDGNVRLVLKDWPIFGGVSVFAAQAVLGAAQLGKYEPAMEAVMKIQGRVSEEAVEQALASVDLPMDRIAAAVNKHNTKISGLLDRNYAQATSFNLVGTPSFVTGTSLYPGVLDEEGLKKAIAKARA